MAAITDEELELLLTTFSRPKPRVTLSVSIELDGLPGFGFHGEDFARHVQEVLSGTIPHYNPVVTILDNPRPKES